MASLLQQGGVPSADSDLRAATANSSSSSSSSSSKINISLQESKFNIVFNIIYHIHGLLNIILSSEPLDMVGSELERQAFADLKAVIASYKQPNSSYFQLLEAFLRNLSTLSSKSYLEMVNLDIVQAWDKTIQVMTVVMPPFHDIFLGHIPQVNDMPSGWLYVIPHYVQALFSDQFKCLDDVLKSCLEKARSDYETDAECNENMSNAIIIQRSPEILAISCESTLLPENLRRQTISSTTTNPSSIEFPLVLDLSVYQMSSSDPGDDDEDEDDEDDDDNESSGHRYYDLVAVISLDTASFTKHLHWLRLSDNGQVGHYGESWSRSADDRDIVSSSVAVEGSYYRSPSSSSVPRFLLYVKRGLSELLNRLQPFVSKAGQCRAMGDMTYALATTIDSYKEARRYYEEAIGYDPSYRDMLKDTLQSLDKIDSIQHSRGLEEQGDISLVNHRLKESCESYAQASASLVGLSAATSSTVASTSSASSSSSSSMSSSLIGLTSLAGLTASYDERLKEKLNLVKQMQSLEIVVHCVEKGEEALKDCKYAIAKDYYTKAAKLNSNSIFSNHFQMISSYVDKTMQTLVAIQKIDDAHLAMKDGKYRLANQLFSEAIILVPDKASGLQGILDGFTPLIQCEDALIQQRAGLAAFEERNYELAKSLLTDAINLLPTERSTDLAIFYADRAMAYQELHEYELALEDCCQSIALKNDYAIAYLRKGAALFSLGRYTDAIAAYDKAEGFDPSLSSQVKVKLRQLNTAKEVALRKEREAERARAKEEEKRLMEQLKREKAERAAQEQVEKAERQRMKEEDKHSKALRDELQSLSSTTTPATSSTTIGSVDGSHSPSITAAAALDKEAEKQRLKELEKQRAKEERAKERERQRVEKEKERERLRQEKEAAAIRQQQEKQEMLALKLQQEQEAIATAAKEQARVQEQQRLERARREEDLRQRQLAREKAERDAAAAREAKLLAQQQLQEQNRLKKLKEEEEAKQRQIQEEARRKQQLEERLAAEAAAAKAAEEAANAIAAAAMENDADIDSALRLPAFDILSLLGSDPMINRPSSQHTSFDVFKSESLMPPLTTLDYLNMESSIVNGSENLLKSSSANDLHRSVTSDSYFGGLLRPLNDVLSNTSVPSSVMTSAHVSPEKKSLASLDNLDSFLSGISLTGSNLGPVSESILSSSSSDARLFTTNRGNLDASGIPLLSIFDNHPSALPAASLALGSNGSESMMLGAGISDLNASAPQWTSYGTTDIWMANQNSLYGDATHPSLDRSLSYPSQDNSSTFNLLSGNRNTYGPGYNPTSGGSPYQPSLQRSTSAIASSSVYGPPDLNNVTRTSSPGFVTQQSLLMHEPQHNMLMDQQSQYPGSTYYPLTSDVDMFNYLGGTANRLHSSSSSNKIIGIGAPTTTIIPDHRFPSLAALRKHNIYLHGWGAIDNSIIDGTSAGIGSGNNYLDYALNLTPEIFNFFTPTKVQEISQHCGCMMWLETIPATSVTMATSRAANGQPLLTYILFHHGILGHDDNQRMQNGLRLVCELIAKLLDITLTEASSPLNKTSVAPSPFSYTEFPPLGANTNSSATSSTAASRVVGSGSPLEDKSNQSNSLLYGKLKSSSSSVPSTSWTNSKAPGLVGYANTGTMLGSSSLLNDGFVGLFGSSVLSTDNASANGDFSALGLGSVTSTGGTNLLFTNNWNGAVRADSSNTLAYDPLGNSLFPAFATSQNPSISRKSN